MKNVVEAYTVMYIAHVSRRSTAFFVGGFLLQSTPGVDLGEELLDRDGCVCRAGRAEDVERVLGAG